ncbi:MAG: RICIN domain-containing protein, partial [Acutalibacteraceae bacterium]
LDLSGANTANKTDILTYKDNGSAAQRWFIYRDSNDSVVLRPACGIKANVVMDLYGISKGAAIPEGRNISIYDYNGSAAQQFKLEYISEDLGTDFDAAISTACDKTKVLAADTNGNVVIKTNNNSDNRLWHFERQSDSTYIITNKANGKCIDLENWSTADMSNIASHTSHGGTNQRWAFVKNAQGSYTIRPVCGFTQNAVMDLYGASTADGSNISIYSYNASPAQQFYVEKTTAQ